MRKHRYFYSENLAELHRIKEEYESKIGELDGVLMREVEEREAALAERNRLKIEEMREISRGRLRQRMAEYDREVKQRIEANIEKLSEEMAVEGAGF
jgi:hypothetical protein